MSQRYYRMAGILFCMDIPQQWLSAEEGLLAPYVVAAPQPGEPVHRCVVSVVDALSEPEGTVVYQDASNRVFTEGEVQIRYKGAVEHTLSGAYMRIRRQGDRSDIQIVKARLPQGIPPRLLVSCMEAVHQITHNGGFLLHASWVRYQDRAILFTGPSGVGKSTQAALWEQLRGAELINGDRAAVFPDGLQVRGIPFCGSSGVNKNETMPLGAVVYLKQAEHTSIQRLKGTAAFRRLWEGCSINLWNAQDLERCTQSVLDVIRQVPVWELSCTPDETAVLALEQEGVF